MFYKTYFRISLKTAYCTTYTGILKYCVSCLHITGLRWYERFDANAESLIVSSYWNWSRYAGSSCRVEVTVVVFYRKIALRKLNVVNHTRKRVNRNTSYAVPALPSRKVNLVMFVHPFKFCTTSYIINPKKTSRSRSL